MDTDGLVFIPLFKTMEFRQRLKIKLFELAANHNDAIIMQKNIVKAPKAVVTVTTTSRPYSW